MTPDREYTVYFHGKMTVEAQSESEATDRAYDDLNEVGKLEFTITSTEEGECVECGGTGEIATDGTDLDGNVERGVNTQKCLCRV